VGTVLAGVSGQCQEIAMVTTEIRLPELGLVAGTRGLLGAGIGLLMADKLTDQQRKSIGRTLLAIGVLTTLPLAVMVFGRRRRL
jgi:hypothetical protein